MAYPKDKTGTISPKISQEEWFEIKRSCEKAEHPTEECIAYTEYGLGFHWSGRYCPACMVFLGPGNYDYEDHPAEEGRPFETS